MDRITIDVQGLASLRGHPGLTEGAGALDLLNVEDLVDLDGISQLPDLEALTLTGRPRPGVFHDLASIETLQRLSVGGYFFDAELDDLDWLVGLDHLKELSLPRCSGIVDCAAFAPLTRLEYLNVHGPLRSLTGLESHGALRSLSVWGCTSLVDLSALRGLERLEELCLAGCTSLATIGPLAEAPSLTSLNLSDCPSLVSIAPVVGLERLVELKLHGCKAVTDLERLTSSPVERLELDGILTDGETDPPAWLGEMPSLRVLSLGENTSLTNVDVLSELTGLSAVALGGCSSLTNVDGLRGLSQLRHLEIVDEDGAIEGAGPGFVGCEALSDISGLSGLHLIEELSFNGCRSLRSIEDIASLGALRFLDLSDCTGLDGIDAVRRLSNLEELYLSGLTCLTDLSAVAGLKKLRRLDLSGCVALTHLDELAGLTSLDFLSLKGCASLKRVDPVAHLPALTWLDLQQCPSLESIDVIAELPDSTAVHLRAGVIDPRSRHAETLAAIQPDAGMVEILSRKGDWAAIVPEQWRGVLTAYGLGTGMVPGLATSGFLELVVRVVRMRLSFGGVARWWQHRHFMEQLQEQFRYARELLRDESDPFDSRGAGPAAWRRLPVEIREDILDDLQGVATVVLNRLRSSKVAAVQSMESTLEWGIWIEQSARILCPESKSQP